MLRRIAYFANAIVVHDFIDIYRKKTKAKVHFTNPLTISIFFSNDLLFYA